MPERFGNIGYMAMKKETTKGTAVTPDVYVPLYDESLMTNANNDEDTPIIGNKLARYQVLPGVRDHSGDFTILGEPNTAARVFDMLLYKSGTSGSGPYTHSFVLSNSNNPNSYTVDLCKGQVVERFMGVEASQIAPSYDKNKMTLKVSVSALKSFVVAEISNVATLVLTLTAPTDPAPTTGLVVSDLVRILKADGTTVDTTITALDATTVTVGSASGVAAGDLLYLRPVSSPTPSIKTPFLWARSEYRFGADATAALSATHTPLEESSSWAVKHNFTDDKGAKRSGSFDPASLPRGDGDVEFNRKEYFDTPTEYNNFIALKKKACVIRHFSEAGYELRITLNNLKQMVNKKSLKSGEIIYADIKYVPTYDTSDGQGFDVKVINNVSSI